MGFKIDENLPVEVADILGASGYNAVTVLDQHLVGAVDPILDGRERLIGTLWIVQEAGIRVREGNVGVD